jgi:hypothetical protein
MEIRLARNEEGLEIKAMFKNASNLPDSDWTDIFPYWAIAIQDGEMIAAIQLCMSKPIGRLEHLLIKDGVNKLTQTRAADALIKYGEVAMQSNGSKLISGYVTFKNKAIKNLIKKHYGAKVVDSGSMLVWRMN